MRSGVASALRARRRRRGAVSSPELTAPARCPCRSASAAFVRPACRSVTLPDSYVVAEVLQGQLVGAAVRAGRRGVAVGVLGDLDERLEVASSCRGRATSGPPASTARCGWRWRSSTTASVSVVRYFTSSQAAFCFSLVLAMPDDRAGEVALAVGVGLVVGDREAARRRSRSRRSASSIMPGPPLAVELHGDLAGVERVLGAPLVTEGGAVLLQLVVAAELVDQALLPVEHRRRTPGRWRPSTCRRRRSTSGPTARRSASWWSRSRGSSA